MTTFFCYCPVVGILFEVLRIVRTITSNGQDIVLMSKMIDKLVGKTRVIPLQNRVICLPNLGHKHSTVNMPYLILPLFGLVILLVKDYKFTDLSNNY